MVLASWRQQAGFPLFGDAGQKQQRSAVTRSHVGTDFSLSVTADEELKHLFSWYYVHTL